MIHLNKEVFKEKLKQYKEGSLSEEEEELFEDELGKLDEYQSFLESESAQEIKNIDHPDKVKGILKRSQTNAYIRIGLVSVITVLLIMPLVNFFASIYYDFGGLSSKSQILKQVTDTVIPITNPNIEIENTQLEHDFLQVRYSFDLFKTTEDEKQFIVSDNVKLVLNKAKRERQTIPLGLSEPLDKKDVIKKINTLNKNDIIDVFVLFNETHDPDDIDTMANKYDIKITWKAVKNYDNDSMHESIIGYPTNFRFSPTEHAASAEKEFEKALTFLSEHEKLTNEISHNIFFSPKEELKSIKENGFSIIGFSITGTSQSVVSFITDQNEQISKVQFVDRR